MLQFKSFHSSFNTIIINYEKRYNFKFEKWIICVINVEVDPRLQLNVFLEQTHQGPM